jgi:CRP/FNR family transcriptional regulator
MPKLAIQITGGLDRIPYLRSMPVPEREALARVCELRQVPRGAAVFSEGAPPAGIFLIVRGRVALVRSSEEGREQVLHEEGPGSTLGEVPVFDGEGYVATATALEDSELLFVPRQPLLAALQRSPGSSLAVIHILAARVRKLAGVVEDLGLHGVMPRLAAYLLREMERAGAPQFSLPATRDHIAAHVGTVREQASRALSQLKAAGVIELHGRRVRVLDPARLRLMSRR